MAQRDARTYVDADMAEVDWWAFAGGQAAVFSAKRPGKTSPNEDAAAAVAWNDSAGALIVADGLGGAASGDVAARISVEAVVESLEKIDDGELPRTAILNGFELANRRVQEMGVGAGSTLVVVEIIGRAIRTYHAGDSVVLVTGQRGRIKLQTVSHSPVGYAVEAGVLDEVQAMHHDQRHVVSNTIGRSDMRIEVGSELSLATYDTVLAASDGLFDNLAVPEAVEQIRKSPLNKSVRALVEESRRRMTEPQPGHPSKPDDLTIVAFRPRRMAGRRRR
jgi:serine/threonine protein phosphatase PrpC